MLTFVIVATIAAVLGAILAGRRNRSAFGWMILCALSPVALLVLLALGPKPTAQ